MKAIDKYMCGLVIMILSFTSLKGSPVRIQFADSVPAKPNVQYNISIAGQSEDHSWMGIRKWYYRNSDTILIFNRKDNQKPSLTLHKMTALNFLGQNKLLAFGNEKAEFHDLVMKAKKEYVNVLYVATVKVSDKQEMFAVVFKGGRVDICDGAGLVKYQLNGVISLQTVVNIGFVVHQKTSTDHKVILIRNSQTVQLFTSNAVINKLVMTDDNRFVAIDECIYSESNPMKTVSDRKLHLIKLETGKCTTVGFKQEANFEDFLLDRIGYTDAYLLTLKKKQEAHNEMLEIWYANESNIKSVYNGKTVKKFYVLHPGNGDAKKLNDYSEDMLVAFTNGNYLMKYHPHRGHNYIFSHPAIQLSLYQIATGKEFPLGTFGGVDYKNPEVIYSKDGKFILGSDDRKKWKVWDLSQLKKIDIPGDSLTFPAFTKDGRAIYFTSMNGLWKFDLLKRNLSMIENTAGRLTTILNPDVARQFQENHFASQELDTSKPILIRSADLDKNTVAYILLKNGQMKSVISETSNKISDIVWNTTLERFFYLTENYNMPPRLYVQCLKKPQRLIFKSNIHDTVVTNIKQDIINYTNSGGQRLKGTLYYPAGYDVKRKYPMVVKVYQIQRALAKEYLIGGYASYVAYDKRALLERGYFVYEPDIVFGKEGTGISALDCVNRAMDALKDHPGINFGKVALTGHSHGGYITNFIATQSDRFATYISGAGNSDIVRSYFSYNRNFDTPFYMQFETGQYKMPVPFSQDKDLYFRNNPIYNVEKINAPILLWAGKKDENIFWEQVQEFYIGLKRNNKYAIALFYTKGNHALGLETREKEDMHKRASEWLDYFLKDKKDVEWISRY